MSRPMVETQLHEHLQRWVADGLITSDQAERIARVEAARPREETAAPVGGGTGQSGAPPVLPPVGGQGAGHPRPVSRLPLVVEALGYLGGLLATIAAVIFVGELWSHIGRSGWLTLAAVAALVLLGAGALVRIEREAAFYRLRCVLWLLSTGSFVAFLALLVEQVWAPRSPWGPFTVALVGAAYAAALWLRFPSPAQHLALFAGSAATAGTLADALWQGHTPWLPGLAIWFFSLGWAGAVRGRLLGSEGVGYLAAAIGLLVGGTMTMERHTVIGLLFALLTVVLLLAAAVVLERAWLFLVGAFGVFVVVPQAVDRFLPSSAARPLTLLGVGVVLIGVALWLARRRAGERTEPVAPDGSPPGE